jgi:hypothetical protein
MKFKNIKKKKYKKKSPSNSRSNPDLIKSSSDKHSHFKLFLPKINLTRLLRLYGTILKIFVAIIFMITSIIVTFDLQENWKTKQSIDLQREALGKELSFWKNFISKNQNYRDAYFQASMLEYRLGNAVKAKKYVEKGLSLDPSSENGRKIEKLLK